MVMARKSAVEELMTKMRETPQLRTRLAREPILLDKTSFECLEIIR